MMIRSIFTGTPQPYIITPRSREEALYGRATLLTPGEIYCLLDSELQSVELKTKLEALRDA